MSTHNLNRYEGAARKSGRSAISTAAVLSALLFTACDFSVTNPGPMQDDALNNPAAAGPIVSGMSQVLSGALWRATYIGAEVAREYVESGRIFTTKLPSLPGQLTRETVTDAVWQQSVRARWVAEDGIRRFREHLPDFASSPHAARALVHAGFANRLLGETFCEAVIDGGDVQPHTVYFERAEAHFTEAIAVATAAELPDVALAARAGRASVRASLGDWAGAVSDAAGIPNSFKYQARFTTTELDQYNILYWANANSPFRTFSVVGTFYEGYYSETGDPRAAWGTNPQYPNGEIATVRWLFPLKYKSRTDAINLVSGRELRLIEAEAALRQGNTPQALNTINALRTSLASDQDGQPLDPWPASSNAETVWRYLKVERGIELWLEGRRLGDLRRWSEDGSPAQVVDVSNRIRLCFPIAQSELNTNRNLGLQHADPVNPLYSGTQSR